MSLKTSLVPPDKYSLCARSRIMEAFAVHIISFFRVKLWVSNEPQVCFYDLLNITHWKSLGFPEAIGEIQYWDWAVVSQVFCPSLLFVYDVFPHGCWGSYSLLMVDLNFFVRASAKSVGSVLLAPFPTRRLVDVYPRRYASKNHWPLTVESNAKRTWATLEHRSVNSSDRSTHKSITPSASHPSEGRYG